MSDGPSGVELEVGLSIEDAGWLDDLGLSEPDLSAFISNRIGAVMAVEATHASFDGRVVEVSLLLASDARVRTLNNQYRKKDTPTNVLSFPAQDISDDGLANPVPPGEPILLGDIAMARETTIGEATAQGKGRLDHFSHLLVHGMLHLLGYDHADDDEATHMENHEVKILKAMGIANPYDLLDDDPLTRAR